MRQVITILIFLLVPAQMSLAQEESAKEARRQATLRFNATYQDQWQIRWDENAGVPASLFGYRVTRYRGAPAQAALAFLGAEKAMFGIEDAERNLRLARNTSEFGGAQVLYEQVYEGVPVLYSGYLVAFDDTGAIVFISGDYYPDLAVDTYPTLQPEAAVTIMSSDLSEFAEVTSQPKLVIYVDQDKETLGYHLAYDAQIQVEEPLQAWEYIIDAHSGEVLRKVSLLADIDGSGKVYKVHPNYAGTTTVTLHRLSNLNPRRLDGDNVVVHNNAVGDATSATGVFNYDPSDASFDDVMAYYHSDEFEAWLITLGLGQTRVGRVTVRTRYPGFYATTFPGCGNPCREIRFGNADTGNGLRNPTREAAIITHEYMHVVSETYNTLTQNNESRAMDEAYSDYFAVANKNLTVTSSIIGDYIDESGGYVWQRNLNNTYNYTQLNSIDLEPNSVVEEHDRSVIFSGALWDFRKDPNVNATQADKIVLASLAYLDSSPSFSDGRDVLRTAASNTGFSQYIGNINEAFAKHGIYSVYITGPSQIQLHLTYTWTANVSGTPSNFSYQWYARYGSTWSLIPTATSPTLTTAFHSSPMPSQLKVVVNRGSQSITATYTLTTIGARLAMASEAAPTLSDLAFTEEELPAEFALEPNYPNPFNPSTEIRFALPEAAHVRLSIYDVTGREVARLVDQSMPSGHHRVTWDAGHLASGIYLYRLTAGAFVETRRMVLSK